MFFKILQNFNSQSDITNWLKWSDSNNWNSYSITVNSILNINSISSFFLSNVLLNKEGNFNTELISTNFLTLKNNFQDSLTNLSCGSVCDNNISATTINVQHQISSATIWDNNLIGKEYIFNSIKINQRPILYSRDNENSGNDEWIWKIPIEAYNQKKIYKIKIYKSSTTKDEKKLAKSFLIIFDTNYIETANLTIWYWISGSQGWIRLNGRVYMTIIIDHTDSQYAYIKFQLISENSSQGVTEKKYYELYDTNICLQNFINSSGINFAACDD